MSRRARGVEIWAALRSLGRQGLIDLVERDCRYAARFAEGLAGAGYEVLNEVVLNQVVVSFGDAQKNAEGRRCHPEGRHLLVRAGRSGRGDPPCASAFHPGRRPRPMSNAAWKRCSGSQRAR